MMRPTTLLFVLGLLAVAFFGSASTSCAQVYCQPSYGTPCNTGGDYIQSFSTTGGTTNITNNNSGCNGSANNYLYYSAQTVTVGTGGSFSFSFTNSPMSAQYYAIWIDWNNNLSFTDPGEVVYTSAGNITAGAVVTGTVNVPAGTAAGTKRLRIRSQFFTNPVTPCGNAFYGETEDYNVQVGGGALGCGGISLNDSAYLVTGLACPSSYITLTLANNSASTTIGVQWQYASTMQGPYLNIGGATSTPVTLPGFGGYYRAALTCLSTSQTSTSTWAYVPTITNCQDSVWPGDANYDLVANNMDLLAITSSWGLAGPSRTSASNSWSPQFAMNWAQVFSNLVNKKNADCDGNGTIGWSDTTAVSQNYGMIHLRPTDSDPPTEKTAGLPDLFVDIAGTAVTPGSTITAPIRFGDAANPVTRMYGIAATVKISGTATVGAPSISLNPSWMGTPTQVLRFAKTTSATTTDFVASRITRRDTAGYGTLGTVSFAIPPNATGKVKVSLQNVRLIDSTGTVLTTYNVVADSANIATTSIRSAGNSFSSAVIIPNPGTFSALEFQLANATRVDVVVIDAIGRKVADARFNLAAGSQRVPLPGPSLPAGVYTVRFLNAGDNVPTSLRWLKH